MGVGGCVAVNGQPLLHCRVEVKQGLVSIFYIHNILNIINTPNVPKHTDIKSI